jgi:hypothetical protein
MQPKVVVEQFLKITTFGETFSFRLIDGGKEAGGIN